MPLTIVIVGGGAAGTLGAIHLAAHPSGVPRRIVVIEPAAELGLGAAYGTRSPSHLLNVRASGMSALPDEPGHFLAWAQRDRMDAEGTDFLPRMLYGRYLRDTLADAAEHVRARAVGLIPDRAARWAITLDDGSTIATDHLILATGNAAAPFPGAPDDPRIVSDPWAPNAIDGLHDAPDVLLIGTGLTAVDVVLTLRDIGHQGIIRMVSAHGLLPQAHLSGPLPGVPRFVTPGDHAAHSVRAAMTAARTAANGTDDWRQVVDGIRSQTVALWRDLPVAEQRRFLRHLARRWAVRRHRMAPQVAAAVQQLQGSGQLVVERGRLSRVDVADGRIRVTVSSAGHERGMAVNGVVLCMGPSADPRHDAFLSGLLEIGMANRHPLGLGLDVDAHGRVLQPDGSPQPGLWAMGSLRTGAEWESTAVPELRLHARDIAAAILAERQIL